MSAIKDGRVLIELDKSRHMLFSMNAIDAIQDKFGSLGDMTDAISEEDSLATMKTVRWLATLLLNEGAAEDEQELTEKQVGRIIHIGNIKSVKDAIFNAFAIGTSGTAEPQETDDEDDLEGDEKNVTGGEVK